MVMPEIHAKRNLRKIGDRNIAKSRLPGRGDIRIQGISESGLRHSQGAFDAVGEIPVFRRQMDQDLAVFRDTESGICRGEQAIKFPVSWLRTRDGYAASG